MTTKTEATDTDTDDSRHGADWYLAIVCLSISLVGASALAWFVSKYVTEKSVKATVAASTAQVNQAITKLDKKVDNNTGKFSRIEHELDEIKQLKREELSILQTFKKRTPNDVFINQNKEFAELKGQLLTQNQTMASVLTQLISMVNEDRWRGSQTQHLIEDLQKDNPELKIQSYEHYKESAKNSTDKGR